jgi:hypothetical protein
MSLTKQQKRGLLWTVGIASAVTLTSLAWHQINATLTHCFGFF